MTLRKLCFGLIFAIGVGTFVGCGSEGNTVTEPTDEFMEEAKKAEEEEASGGALPQ